MERRFCYGLAVGVFRFVLVYLPEDDLRAVLATSDVSAAFRSLLIGEPIRGAVPAGRQQKHVDTAIGASAGEILGILRSPGPPPTAGK